MYSFIFSQVSTWRFSVLIFSPLSPTALVETIKKNAFTILNEFEEGNVSWVEAQAETPELISGQSVELHVTDDIEGITSSTHTSWDKVLDTLYLI